VRKAKAFHHKDTCMLVKKAIMGFREAKFLFYRWKYHKVKFLRGKKVIRKCVLDLYYQIGVLKGVVRVVYVGKAREPLYWNDLKWIEGVIPHQHNSYILILTSGFIHPPAYRRLKDILHKYDEWGFHWVEVLNSTIPYYGISRSLEDRWKAKRKRSWKEYGKWFNKHAHEFGMGNRPIRMPSELPPERFVLHVFYALRYFWRAFLKTLCVVYPQFRLLLRMLEKYSVRVADVYSEAWDKIVEIKGSKIKEIEGMLRLLCSEGWAKFIKRWKDFIRYKVGFDPP